MNARVRPDPIVFATARAPSMEYLANCALLRGAPQGVGRNRGPDRAPSMTPWPSSFAPPILGRQETIE
eukprot:2872566-Lingulodinium_polyedra.AAC.1